MSSGYQALHTAIVFRVRHAEDHPDEQTLIELRILTPDMDRLNEGGIVEFAYHHREQDRHVPAWWNRLDRLKRQLKTRYGQSTTFESFLRDHDLGTQSNPLYVFTPRGELILLEEKSTPVDLAYRIHTELGHHAARVKVNNVQVPHHYPLHNGDLVEIEYDPFYRGPELSWISFVALSSTREKIRHGLRARADATHEGRARIVEMLIRLSRAYASKSKFRLDFTNAELDDFLIRAAKARKLPDLNALYDEALRDRILPAKLIQLLVSEHLSPIILRRNGERLPYPAHMIQLCETCQPAPGQPIVGIERRAGRSRVGLTIHRLANEGRCNALRTSAGRRIALHWSETGEPAGKEAVMYQINAEDRRGLLGDALAEVYTHPSATLLKVDARSSLDNSATISLAVEAGAIGDVSEIQAQLQSVRGVRQVQSYPLDQSQRAALKPVAGSQRPPNPYSIGQEVYARLSFFDREEPIAQLLSWLEEPPPTSLMIVHGQRRVGKSSLAKYLVHEILPIRRLATPVYLTLQSLAGYTSGHFADLLAQALGAQLKRALPPRPSGAPPMMWLGQALRDAAADLPTRRLCIILDEFDVLARYEQEARLEPMLIHNVRALINEQRDINFLLIAQDNYFLAAGGIGSAGMLFQQARDIGLTHFEASYADKLIIEPARRCGIEYEDPVAGTITTLTAGNPYLIQLMCHKVIERSRKAGRSNVTPDDLEREVALIVADGARHFDHFVGNLKDHPKVLLSALAAWTPEEQWSDLDSVIADLRAKAKWLRADRLYEAAETLDRQGMLASKPVTGSTSAAAAQTRVQVRLPICLFHRYVRRHVDLADALAELKPKRRSTKS